ncbi:hypothetical protein L3Q82_015628 [Scortum barcoo]|uniref:Uncharacterized protein n=1 Tax=Scortum barcoo TaxID=214431 RepID=A0ACB8VNW5_9TELE|nr:hypothetical protein L3Q82_015628 [Scortum barcoo]
MPDFDLSPLSSADFLNGDGFPLPLDGFINLSPPHSHDYHFGLEDNEGISELFDCIEDGHCQLKFVNFEAHENHISHETQGLSKKHLVVRRGKPFKITLLFHSRSWNPHTERLVLEVGLDTLSTKIPVQFSDKQSNIHDWSAKIYPGNMHPHSVTIHLCSPVLSSVALYNLRVHIETMQNRRSYAVGTFVLLCNPWLKEIVPRHCCCFSDDPVYIPLDDEIEEYVKSDYGLMYMGTHLNIIRRPWSFGQYEPGVLEACLTLLQVSPQHLNNKRKDYILRADPVYLSRVVCAMVNCNDDLGILEGKWQGNYKDGVKPTEWSGSADILRRWVSTGCSPVRYGQCWVFASVLCTVMRVLGIPSRVVTVFNAAHDGDGSLKIEEVYSSTGEKLKLSKDSLWNFHVWVECWMRRPDLGGGFDGWQVVDPTPQEKSAGIFCCGPCPVVAVQSRSLGAPYDTSFIYASVDADVIRLIVRDGLIVGRELDTELVGQLIYTKSIGSDKPQNLTQTYKSKKGKARSAVCGASRRYKRHSEGRLFHLSTVHVLKRHHTIPPSVYESALVGDDIVNLAVVIKDVRTKERVLATEEFSLSSPQITIEIEGGDTVQMQREHTAQVSFSNMFTKILYQAVLTVEGSGLLQGKREARLVLLQPGQKIETKVSIMATSPGTKILMATFSHNNSMNVVSRSFHRVSVMAAMSPSSVLPLQQQQQQLQ